jgi:hypothetical protein
VPSADKLHGSRIAAWRRKLHLTPVGVVLSVIDTSRGRELISRNRALVAAILLAAAIAALAWRYTN